MTRLALRTALLLACLGPAACSSPPGGVAARPSTKPPSLLQLGDDLQRTGDTEGAASLYRAAIGQDGRNAVALTRLGQMSLAADPARAEQAFRAALTLDGSSADARRGLAVSLLAQSRFDEALPLLATLADTQPSPVSMLLYGTALDMAGRQDAAQAAYRRGLALSPADADLHGNLALSLLVAGQTDAALTEMHAAQLAPLPDSRQDANSVLVLAVVGRESEARQQGVTLIGPARTEVVMRQAARVRAAADPASRARALGLLIAAARPQPAPEATPATAPAAD